MYHRRIYDRLPPPGGLGNQLFTHVSPILKSPKTTKRETQKWDHLLPRPIRRRRNIRRLHQNLKRLIHRRRRIHTPTPTPTRRQLTRTGGRGVGSVTSRLHERTVGIHETWRAVTDFIPVQRVIDEELVRAVDGKGPEPRGPVGGLEENAAGRVSSVW